jgi:trimeric autotransporter adhesin
MYNLGPWGRDESVKSFTTFDDGSGPALFAGGRFTEAGGIPAINIAKWDGQSWSALGDGLPGLEIRDLAVYDDGTGPALYAGGVTPPSVPNVAKWDGQRWQAVGGDVNSIVHGLGVHDDGTGPALYAGGQFTQAGSLPVNHVARWDGQSWSSPGTGTDGIVWSFHSFDDGTGPGLYVGGSFFEAGGIPSWGIARWDGQWSPLGSGLWNGPTFGPIAFAMTTFDDGTGPALYVGGEFKEAGGVPANCIARWRCERVCYPDCDGSGSLDFFDFLCFQNAFLANDPYADCDRDGTLTFFDFLCSQNEFLAGCQ